MIFRSSLLFVLMIKAINNYYKLGEYAEQPLSAENPTEEKNDNITPQIFKQIQSMIGERILNFIS